MSLGPGESPSRVRIGLLAGGPDGLALLQLLHGWPAATLVFAVDPLPEATVLREARARGIPAAAGPLEVFEQLPVDLIIDAVGRRDIVEVLLRARRPGIEVMARGASRSSDSSCAT